VTKKVGLYSAGLDILTGHQGKERGLSGSSPHSDIHLLHHNKINLSHVTSGLFSSRVQIRVRVTVRLRNEYTVNRYCEFYVHRFLGEWKFVED